MAENDYARKYDLGNAQMFVIEGMDKVREVIEKNRKAFGPVLKEVTADSGYCSEKNLLYLKRNDIASYIKLQDHEKRKKHAYTEDISKYYNMETKVFEDEQYYICHDGRELRHMRTEKKEQDGYTQTLEVYGCADCSGCAHKSRCLYKYDPDKDAEKNKVMKINEQWEELKEQSNANIQSERGDSEVADTIHPDRRAFWRHQGKRKLPSV